MEGEVLSNSTKKDSGILQSNMTSSSYNNKLSKINVSPRLKQMKGDSKNQ